MHACKSEEVLRKRTVAWDTDYLPAIRKNPRLAEKTQLSPDKEDGSAVPRALFYYKNTHA